jgi:hypothetical protein
MQDALEVELEVRPTSPLIPCFLEAMVLQVAESLSVGIFLFSTVA